MARAEKRLTAKAVEKATRPGAYQDGGGLFLDVTADGRRRWIWRYRMGEKRRDMGLGAAGQVSLAEARTGRDKWRAVLREGRDPIEARAQRREPEKRVTFGEAADSYVDAHKGGWRNAKHKAQWSMTLTRYCESIRDTAVEAIDTAAVLDVLKPLWEKAPERASRLRGRIEAVLAAAQARGLIEPHKANPARWRGHLDRLLPKPRKLARGHHAALPYGDVPAFVARLRDRPAVAARALEFAVLTTARSGEVLGARWEEIDTAGKLWTVPPVRMKAHKEHRVPLADRALEILREMKEVRSGDYVFSGQRKGRPLSGMSMEMLLRRMDVDVTPHGFRSSFRDWAGDVTHFPREVIEAALAHAIENKTEAAYRRSDALAKRRSLMDSWAVYVESRVGLDVEQRGDGGDGDSPHADDFARAQHAVTNEPVDGASRAAQ